MNKNVVIEFANTLSEEDLRFLISRLNDDLQGDLDEAINFMSNSKPIDHILSSTKTAIDLYDACDQIAEILQRENRKRNPVQIRC